MIGGAKFDTVAAVAHTTGGDTPNSGHYTVWVPHGTGWAHISDDVVGLHPNFPPKLQDIAILFLQRTD